MTATVNTARTSPNMGPDFTDTTDESGAVVATWSFADESGYIINGSIYAKDDAVTATLWECEPGDPSHGIGDGPVEMWRRDNNNRLTKWEFDGPYNG